MAMKRIDNGAEEDLPGLHVSDTEDEDGNTALSKEKDRKQRPKKRVKLSRRESGNRSMDQNSIPTGFGKSAGTLTDEDDDQYDRWRLSNAKDIGKRSGRKDVHPIKREPEFNQTKARNKKRQEHPLMEEEKESHLPDYLQARQDKLGPEDDRPVELLSIPPSFEDIYFPEDERLEDLEEKPQFPHSEPARGYVDINWPTTLGVIPAPIAQWLRDYQVEGAKRMHTAFVYQKGFILGDDMGLGKTVQVISFLTAAFGKTGDERDLKRMRVWRRKYGMEKWYPRVLIVCPSTLMDNWLDEFERWGWWHVQRYHGRDKEDAMAAALNGRLEVMITSYQTYRSDLAKINRIPWDAVIADECHIIKEITAETTKAMQLVNALCRIGLTGTAIQNNYEELWTLLNWCSPGTLGTLRTWKRTISHPLKVGQSHSATSRELGNARIIAKKLVTGLLPRFFLRRTKAIIRDSLPKKTDRVVFCPLTDVQEAAYLRFLDSDMVRVVRDVDLPCECESGKVSGKCCYSTDSKGRSRKELIFPCMHASLYWSNHVATWLPTQEDDAEKRQKKDEMLRLCLPDLRAQLLNRTPLENYMDPDLCGKWVVLRDLLKFWKDQDDGSKILIFSYSLLYLKILSHLLANTSYTHQYLSGELKLNERTQAVKDFSVDPNCFVFLISARAGGVGLNITAANKVVIFDPSWNPSQDAQAMDRAYRFGQKRDVEVFRLISVGTVEEIVYSRQIYKQQMANIGYGATAERRYFEGVMDDKTRKGELFGVKNIFTYNRDIRLKEILHKTNVAEARAGFKIAEFVDPDEALEDPGDDPDKLLAELEGTSVKGKPKAHPVQAILDIAGVPYTHENAEVLGTSHVENLISRHAEKLREEPFKLGEDMNYTSRQMLHEKPIFADDEDGELVYKFKPPTPVKLRQFRSMAHFYGYENLTEFALVVEDWSKKERTEKLETFYKMRKRMLEIEPVGDRADEEEVIVKEEPATGLLLSTHLACKSPEVDRANVPVSDNGVNEANSSGGSGLRIKHEPRRPDNLHVMKRGSPIILDETDSSDGEL